jgi:hypothetical protein
VGKGTDLTRRATKALPSRTRNCTSVAALSLATTPASVLAGGSRVDASAAWLRLQRASIFASMSTGSKTRPYFSWSMSWITVHTAPNLLATGSIGDLSKAVGDSLERLLRLLFCLGLEAGEA